MGELTLSYKIPVAMSARNNAAVYCLFLLYESLAPLLLLTLRCLRHLWNPIYTWSSRWLLSTNLYKNKSQFSSGFWWERFKQRISFCLVLPGRYAPESGRDLFILENHDTSRPWLTPDWPDRTSKLARIARLINMRTFALDPKDYSTREIEHDYS